MTDACKQFDSLLMDFAYGELPENQAAKLRAHAAQCASCRAALDKVALVRTMAKQLPLLEPEMPLDGAVLSQLAQATPNPERIPATAPLEPPLWERLRAFLLSPALATAAVIALVFVISFFLVQKGPLKKPPTHESGRVAFETLAPESVPPTTADQNVGERSPSLPRGPAAKKKSTPAKPPAAPSRARRASPSQGTQQLSKESHTAFAPAPEATAMRSNRLSRQPESGGAPQVVSKSGKARVLKPSSFAMEEKETAPKRRRAGDTIDDLDMDRPKQEPLAAGQQAEEARVEPPTEELSDEAVSDYHLGKNAYARGDCDTARAAFLRVVNLASAPASEKSYAMHRIAACEKQQGRCDKAIPWYEKLLNRYPRYPGKASALWQASTCYRRLGRLEQARTALHRLSRLPGWETTAKEGLDALTAD